jgi:hypothetical protein
MRLIALAALLLSSSAFAQDSTTLTWTNPATYDDGTPLDPAEIVSHRVQWTRFDNCPGFGWVPAAGNVVVQGNASTATITILTAGLHCFRVFVTARYPACTVTATETCLSEGLASNVWSRTFSGPVQVVPAKKPGPPTGLSGN